MLAADEDHIIIDRANSFYYYFILTTLRNMKVVAEKRTITVSQQCVKLPKHNTTKLYAHWYSHVDATFGGITVSIKETLLLLLLRVALNGLCKAKQNPFN